MDAELWAHRELFRTSTQALLDHPPLKYGATYVHPAWCAASAWSSENRHVPSVCIPSFFSSAQDTALSADTVIFMHTRSFVIPATSFKRETSFLACATVAGVE